MLDTEAEIAYQFVCEVKEALKTKNRFTIDPRMEKLIEMYANEDSNIITLDSGKVLYRARVYKEDDAQARFKNPPKDRFKGYDKQNSFVNLNSDTIIDQRCNPAYISYLYVSKTEECCIHEMRPTKGDFLSIARIKVVDDLKLLYVQRGIAISGNPDELIPGVWNSTLFLYLAEEFSRPSKNPGGYLLCQYISEKVKQMGFDGLAYNSAVYDPKNPKDLDANQNIVVFNYEKCKPISSRLRQITDLKIAFQ